MAAETMDRKYGETPPRLVVEVRSPSDKERRVRKRLEEYLRFGVSMVWLVEPDRKPVKVAAYGADRAAGDSR